jgi:Carbon-nitrogen hydrolase
MRNIGYLIRLAFLAFISGCLGVTVCYDLRFPEMYTQLVQTMGAHVLLVPSAFTVPTGRAHWHTLLRGTQAQIVFPKRLDPCGSLGSLTVCKSCALSLCSAGD